MTPRVAATGFRQVVIALVTLAGLVVLLDRPGVAAGVLVLAVVGSLVLRGRAPIVLTSGAARPGVRAQQRRRRANHRTALRLQNPDTPGRTRSRAPSADPTA